MINQHLTHLESTGLLRLAQTHPELEYLFRHALVQDAAYESLLLADRKRLHLQAGETIERLYPDRLDELAPVLGQHFDFAGEDQRALQYFILAGDVEARRHANAEAVGHYTRALNIALKDEHTRNQLHYLGQTLGRVLELSSRYDEAMAHYRDMKTLAQQQDDPALELISLLGRAILRNTNSPFYHVERGQTLAEQALAQARELNDVAAEAKSLWVLMLCYAHQLKNSQAIAYGEQSIALCRIHNLRELLAFCLNDISRAYMATARLADARVNLTEANGLWRQLNNQHMLVESLVFLSISDHLLGDYDRVISRTTEALQMAETIGNVFGQGYALSVMARVFWERGQINQTLKIFEGSIERTEKLHFFTLLPSVCAELGWMYASLGDGRRGRALADKARQTLDHVGEIPLPFHRWTVAALARLEVALGNLAAARADLRHPVIDFESMDFNSMAPVLTNLARVELALAQGEYSQAVDAAESYIERMRHLGVRPGLPDVLLLKGQALLKLEQPVTAREAFTLARTEAEAIGSKRMLWQILAALAAIEADPNEAESLRQQARGIIEYIANHTPAELRTSFLDLPQVQAVLNK